MKYIKITFVLIILYVLVTNGETVSKIFIAVKDTFRKGISSLTDAGGTQ